MDSDGFRRTITTISTTISPLKGQTVLWPQRRLHMPKILVDDTRVLPKRAKDDGWIILRKGEDLPEWFAVNGWPEAIALDYDLELGGGSWDGARVARWLVSEWTNKTTSTKDFPLWDVHSRKPSNNAEVAGILSAFAGRHQPGLAPFKQG